MRLSIKPLIITGAVVVLHLASGVTRAESVVQKAGC